MKYDLPYLVYVRDSLNHIAQLTPPSELELRSKEFEHRLAAILYYLHTLAEATQRISASRKASYPQIEWEGIVGFRNRLVHGYLQVNPAIVWNVIQNDLPPLKAVIEAMIEEIESASE